ncbi:MAG: glycoside hydrolase family 38 C-terminal domain-containing protein [Mycobacterium sp.]
MSNGLVTVDVDPAEGTFAVDGLAGFDRLVDSGDHGDTYNYSPPEDDKIVDRPESVSVRVLETGPLRSTCEVLRTYLWPERIDHHSRVGERTVEVRTTIELLAASPLARVTTRLDNPSRDHRLRSLFPLPVPATHSKAECAFTVVERGLEAEGGPSERGLATVPSRRFVSAGGLTVVHEGLLEYELVDIEDGRARALALTLMRSTGMLSRVEMTYRPVPAGPFLPLEGPQLRGSMELHYAVCVAEIDPYAAADEALVPLRVVRAPGGGDLPSAGSALGVGGAEVSAVRREAGLLEVRVFNPCAEQTTVTIDGRSGWLVDLKGQAVEPFDGSFPLSPWAIATARLAP